MKKVKSVLSGAKRRCGTIDYKRLSDTFQDDSGTNAYISQNL